MDFESKCGADFFLRDIPEVTSSSVNKKKEPPKVVKEELQFLHLSAKVQEQIVDTIKYINGKDFTFNDASMYKDTNSNFMKKYWNERGNLVVRGGFDYSQANTTNGEGDEERLKTFALLRLESYGFHKEHCLEAFQYTDYNIDEALFVLYSKYFDVEPKKDVEHNLSEKELLELRLDEKSSLESIYDKQFFEKVKNSVWILTLKLDYLVNFFHRKNIKKKVVQVKKKVEMCRGFLRGHCKYGNNCRFSHEQIVTKNDNEHIDNYIFELEIRFPHDTIYPYEPPLIFLKTTAVVPLLSLLHICKRLYEEATQLAEHGMPSIYAVTELLLNEEEMMHHLKKEPSFLRNYEKLFPTEFAPVVKLNRPSHYKKGCTGRDNKTHLTIQELMVGNKTLVNNFMAKVKDDRYIKMLKSRKDLPAWNMCKDILNTIESSQVVVVIGETGCGKSTQIPQFILDDWLINYSDRNKKHIEIICTQPRRISAVGVAQRVSEERIESVGNVVGYHIRLENKISANTRLTFCTTRILLRRLENDPLLTTVSHIIVDEVHERSEESDFLLLILKNLLPLRPELKVILMSATLNAHIFCDYFGKVPVIEIPGRTFPVEQYFLEDALEITDYVLEENSEYSKYIKWNEELEECFRGNESVVESALPKINIKDENLTFPQMASRYKKYSKKTCKNLYFWDFNKINYDFIETVLLWIVKGDHSYPRDGSILIFLPGIAEITTLYEKLNIHPQFGTKNKDKYVLVPLHSSLTTEEQACVFKKMKPGVRKVVISTNIAETSVTIDDCVFVIDCGKMKEKHFDSNRNMESLETVWVTRANALQRKGRAGRVRSGVCFHLYTYHMFKHNMLPQPVPEIHRKPLEQLLLNIKLLPNFMNKSVYEVLNGLIEPPVKENINSSILRLQDVGAFDKDSNLTPLGHHLATLPVDVRIGKLMLYGAIFNCVDSALTMAAILSYKTPFIAPFNKKDRADAKKRKFSLAYSDHITTLNAYQKWLEVNRKGYQAGRNFADENFLSYKTLQMISKLKYQFLELLVSIGFVPVDIHYKHQPDQDEINKITGVEFNKNGENTRILSAILCAALYPNIIKILKPGKSFQGSAMGAIPKDLEVKDLKFKTKRDWVHLHPSSVNSIVNNFPSSYLVYQEIIKTSKIFVRDCTMVPVIPLVLFSSYDIEISVCNGSTFVSLDEGWIVFKVEEHRIAEMVKMIRMELQNVLEEKIMDPLLNLHHHNKGEKVISTIINMVNE